jgi:hypothetical protein
MTSLVPVTISLRNVLCYIDYTGIVLYRSSGVAPSVGEEIS